MTDDELRGGLPGTLLGAAALAGFAASFAVMVAMLGQAAMEVLAAGIDTLPGMVGGLGLGGGL